MKNLRTLSVAALVFLQLSLATSTSGRSMIQDSGSNYEKTISQKFSAIAIENPNGRTDVETWNSPRLKVIATRQPGKLNEKSIDSWPRFQIADSDLRFAVQCCRGATAINHKGLPPRQIA